uniref:Four helix bundle protein n=1 Tax=candidate division WOR-3 bacterium TaxID=2052148 RepID=A0A7V0Z5X2_UNCW3
MDNNGKKANGQCSKKFGLKAHVQMIVWQNIDKLDSYVQVLLKKMPKNEFKIKSQIDDASDSIGANFVEEYYSDSLSEYLRFLRYSRRSAEELRERVRRVLRKGYISEKEYETFNKLAVSTSYLLARLIQSLESKKESN